MTRLAVFCLPLVVLSLLALPLAADASEEATALVAELAAAGKAKNEAGATDALGRVLAVYDGLEDKALRGKLLAEVGKIVKNKKLGGARIVAVTTLTDMGAAADAKGAWKQLSKYMPNPKKVEEATELDTAIVTAAGKLAQARAVKPLLEVAQKCKDNKLAAAAALALGGFGADKKNRVNVLSELLDLGKRTRPGRSTDKQVSPVARQRWADIGPSIVGAMNQLTGRRERSFEDWEDLAKDAKKKLGTLFESDED